MTSFPSGPMVRDRTTFAARQSPLGIPMLMTGISRSLTTDVTTRPRAAPVMTPTASASAFCLRRNSRNSRYMAPAIIRGAGVNVVCGTDGPMGWVGKDQSVLPTPPYGPIGPTRLLLVGRRSGRDRVHRFGLFVGRQLAQHLGADRKDEREAVVALH